MYTRIFRQRGRWTGTENSLVAIEQFEFVLQNAMISGEGFNEQIVHNRNVNEYWRNKE